TGLVFLGIAELGAFVFKAEAMGYGDVKLCAFLGLVLGPRPTFNAIVLGVILAGVVAVGLLALRLRGMRDSISYGPFLAGGAVVVLDVWMLLVWLRWAEDSLTVTDQRVLLEEGVLVRSSRVIPLHRVQDVSTTQTLLGRILGYGTVEIDAAGTGGSERFAYVR